MPKNLLDKWTEETDSTFLCWKCASDEMDNYSYSAALERLLLVARGGATDKELREAATSEHLLLQTYALDCKFF